MPGQELVNTVDGVIGDVGYLCPHSIIPPENQAEQTLLGRRLQHKSVRPIRNRPKAGRLILRYELYGGYAISGNNGAMTKRSEAFCMARAVAAAMNAGRMPAQRNITYPNEKTAPPMNVQSPWIIPPFRKWPSMPILAATMAGRFALDTCKKAKGDPIRKKFSMLFFDDLASTMIGCKAAEAVGRAASE